MTNVIAKIKVMPVDTDVDLGKLSKKIEKLGGKRVIKRPIAFGLNAIECEFAVLDGAGGTQSVEEKLAKLEGVGEVQVTDLGREIDASDF